MIVDLSLLNNSLDDLLEKLQFGTNIQDVNYKSHWALVLRVIAGLAFLSACSSDLANSDATSVSTVVFSPTPEAMETSNLAAACDEISESLSELVRVGKYFTNKAATVSEMIYALKQAGDSVDDASTRLTSSSNREVFSLYSLNLNKLRLLAIKAAPMPRDLNSQIIAAADGLIGLCPNQPIPFGSQ